MATLCSTYVSASVARGGVEALRAGGVPGRDIRVLIGCPAHDTRRERVGGFAGPAGPDAPVGTFGNVRRRRREGKGAEVAEITPCDARERLEHITAA